MGRIWRHIPKGLERALLIARQIVDGKAPEVPIEAAKIVTTLSQQALDIHVRFREIDRDLAVCLRGNDVARRLMTIPGIGPVSATALAASVTDPHQFRSGQQFAAWLGLTPLQKSSGGKERSVVSPRGRQVPAQADIIVGMTSLVRRAKYSPGKINPRLADLLARKPTRVATVAMANKTARIIWRSWRVARPILPATGRHWPHKQAIHDLAEEEISFTGLRARCDGRPVRPGTGTTHPMSKAS